MTRPLLIAGIGNLFLGDDAFGCEVTRRLAERYAGELRDGVSLHDFGVSVRALGYALAARAEAGDEGTVILVDAVATGCAPGTMQLFDLGATPLQAAPAQNNAAFVVDHAHGLEDALTTARTLGARLPCLYLLGCEPASLESDWDAQPTAACVLTPEVEAAACRCVAWLGRMIEKPDTDLVSLCAT